MIMPENEPAFRKVEVLRIHASTEKPGVQIPELKIEPREGLTTPQISENCCLHCTERWQTCSGLTGTFGNIVYLYPKGSDLNDVQETAKALNDAPCRINQRNAVVSAIEDYLVDKEDSPLLRDFLRICNAPQN